MIESLHIKNFQIFEDLKINELRRINLIAGKNNVGKTALLEALRILFSSGESTVINHILKQRGQFKPSNHNSYAAIYNRNYLRNNQDHEKILLVNKLAIKKDLNSIYKVGERNLNPNDNPDYPADTAVYVPFGSSLANTRDLWDKIVLTPLEDDVFYIIRETVEPRLVRLDFTSENVKVRLKDEQQPVPLQTLGDGVQRMLLLAIAIVSAKGKYLLIDEFEAGLHHSVQEKLWDLVFHYAKQLDVQLFITTHSEDTLKSFYYVSSRVENEKEALFIRLQFDRTGKHEAQIYDMHRLGDSLELQLETR